MQDCKTSSPICSAACAREEDVDPESRSFNKRSKREDDPFFSFASVMVEKSEDIGVKMFEYCAD